MNLETVVKLIKNKTNLFGLVNAKDIINSLKDNYEYLEMRISIIKEPGCNQEDKDIFENIIIPLIKAKGCMFQPSSDVLHVFARSLFVLRLIDRSCCLLNSQLSEKYKFTIETNYDIIAEEYNKGELS